MKTIEAVSNAAAEFQIVENTLSDGSHTHDVYMEMNDGKKIAFNCTSLRHAHQVLNALEECVGVDSLRGC
jgi:hypothetical protein